MGWLIRTDPETRKSEFLGEPPFELESISREDPGHVLKDAVNKTKFNQFYRELGYEVEEGVIEKRTRLWFEKGMAKNE